MSAADHFAPAWVTASRFARGRPSWRLLGTTALIGSLGLFVGALLVRGDSAFSPFWDGWVANAPLVGCVVACFARAAHGGSRRVGAAWLGAAMVAFTVGNVIYIAWTEFQPDPSMSAPSGIGYVLVYPCVVMAMVRLIRRDGRSSNRVLLLDGALGAAGAATGLAVVLNPLLVSKGNLSVVLVGGDLLIVGITCGVLVVRGLRPGPMWSQMIIGLFLFCNADFSYACRSMSHTYRAGTILDALWAAGLVVMALALWRRDTPSNTVDAERTAAVLVVPLAATTTAVVVLVIASLGGLSTVAVGLATITLLLAAIRTFVSFRHIQRLTDALERASTDDLTGLGNRKALFEQGSARLAADPPTRISLLLIDLNDFREVNDTLGHQAGDQLLRVVAGRLEAVVGPSDLLVRLGGDEFAVLMGLGADVDEMDVAQTLLAHLARPVTVNGLRTHVAASAGLAERAGTGDSVDEMLRRAEVAMYAAKTAGAVMERYSPKLDEAMRARIETINDLDRAFAGHEFVLFYQPKIDLGTGSVCGVEGLVRWNHPTRGLVFPDQFLDVVEQSGRMSALTTAVLELGIRQIAAWNDAGLDVPVAINLSATDLLDDGLADRIVDLLDRHAVTPGMLVLEITESVLMTDRASAVRVLTHLRRLGLRISVDDYGTGYCSLAYLRDLPVDELKIDRSFVDHAEGDARSAAIVRSTIDLAHALGLTVVAEGVEREHTLLALTAKGCDCAQGYFFSRPISAEAFAAWHVDRLQLQAAAA